MFDAGIISVARVEREEDAPVSSDFTSTPHNPCAMTGAPKILSSSAASARSARGMGWEGWLADARRGM